jgi:hypothetical protein
MGATAGSLASAENPPFPSLFSITTDVPSFAASGCPMKPRVDVIATARRRADKNTHRFAVKERLQFQGVRQPAPAGSHCSPHECSAMKKHGFRRNTS